MKESRKFHLQVTIMLKEKESDLRINLHSIREIAKLEEPVLSIATDYDL
jgi:hypothetical protein